MPTPVGEVAAAIIGDNMYLAGQKERNTYVYNIPTNTWSVGPTRKYQGNHHGTLVHDATWYMIGGFGSSASHIQKLNPTTDTAFSNEADMPADYTPGSPCVGVIDNDIIIAGGNLDDVTYDKTYIYNLVSKTFTEGPAMPLKRNHAACGVVDGKLYVFGGRDGENKPALGYSDIMTFDMTNGWTVLAETMPFPRGGHGNAPFISSLNSFLIMGGETKGDPNASENRVFPQLQAFNVETNTFTDLADMITPRHGIWPVEKDGIVYVAGGGIKSGDSQTDILEVYFV
jgi:hypothetical protein